MKTSVMPPLLVALIWLTSGLALADEGQDPRAHRYLWEMGQYLGSVEQFYFQSETWAEAKAAGQWVDNGAVTDIYVQRPDGVRARRAGDKGPFNLFYDGKHLTVSSPGKNFYARSEAPDNLEAMLDYAVAELGLVLPMADFLFRDSYQVLTENVVASHFLGIHEVRGVPCYHLAFKQKNGVEWQIWIEEGKQMVPRKFSIRYLDGAKFVAYLRDWDVLTHLPVTLFQFEKPKGAMEVPFRTVKESE